MNKSQGFPESELRKHGTRWAEHVMEGRDTALFLALCAFDMYAASLWASYEGKAEPVPAWAVLTARESRTRLGVEAERGLTPYVGRGRERQIVSDCFRRVRTSSVT